VLHHNGVMTIRVGVIGTGNIGTSHARDLATRVSGSAVTTLYDSDTARAGELAAELGASAVPSYQALIASPDVDAVLIASPDDFHAEQALACLAAGKPMLCEKPLAPVEADALGVVNAEVALGRRMIMMGFMRRFDRGYAELKAEFTDEGIGEPLIVHHLHTNRSAPYGLASARTMTNMVIHEFDINRWLLEEEYASIQVIAGKPGPDTPEGELDPLLVIMRMESGTLVEVEAFVNAQYGYEVSCRVTGSRGGAQMGEGSYITRSAAGIRGQEVPELWLGRFADAYHRQLQAWIDHLRIGGPVPGASAWDGYVATIIANHAVEALHSGRPVAVELPERPALYA
jgi:myo-inositol 2-dehydrogenase/D-chiro-inositol 1-dehydrogenase